MSACSFGKWTMHGFGPAHVAVQENWNSYRKYTRVSGKCVTCGILEKVICFLWREFGWVGFMQRCPRRLDTPCARHEILEPASGSWVEEDAPSPFSPLLVLSP